MPTAVLLLALPASAQERAVDDIRFTASYGMRVSQNLPRRRWEESAGV